MFESKSYRLQATTPMMIKRRTATTPAPPATPPITAKRWRNVILDVNYSLAHKLRKSIIQMPHKYTVQICLTDILL